MTRTLLFHVYLRFKPAIYYSRPPGSRSGIILIFAFLWKFLVHELPDYRLLPYFSTHILNIKVDSNPTNFFDKMRNCSNLALYILEGFFVLFFFIFIRLPKNKIFLSNAVLCWFSLWMFFKLTCEPLFSDGPLKNAFKSSLLRAPLPLQ